MDRAPGGTSRPVPPSFLRQFHKSWTAGGVTGRWTRVRRTEGGHVDVAPTDDPPAVIDDALLAQLVRDLADAVVIADTDGTIIFWNRGARPICSAGSRTRRSSVDGLDHPGAVAHESLGGLPPSDGVGADLLCGVCSRYQPFAGTERRCRWRSPFRCSSAMARPSRTRSPPFCATTHSDSSSDVTRALRQRGRWDPDKSKVKSG